MSYEGYEVYLCKEGHFHADCYDYSDERLCDVMLVDGTKCGKKLLFAYAVDQTNCGGHPYPLEVKRPAITETCPHCGHTKVLEPALYKMPTEKEKREFYDNLPLCEECGIGKPNLSDEKGQEI